MSIYKFYDTDLSGREELDICGEAYYSLMQTCFHYCDSFSIYVRIDGKPHVNIPRELERFRIPVTEQVISAYRHYSETLDRKTHEIRHYALCSEVQEILLNITDSIFKWICGWGYANPEDPAFFRSDGTVFFSSLIHEGECTLSPNENENIKIVISNNNWVKATNTDT